MLNKVGEEEDEEIPQISSTQEINDLIKEDDMSELSRQLAEDSEAFQE